MYLYHLTKKSNLLSIKENGLIPTIGNNSKAFGEKFEAIYFFKDEISAEDALLNWFGDQFDDDDELILLKVKHDFKTYASTAEFEVFTKDNVPFSKVEDIKNIL